MIILNLFWGSLGHSVPYALCAMRVMVVAALSKIAYKSKDHLWCSTRIFMMSESWQCHSCTFHPRTNNMGLLTTGLLLQEPTDKYIHISQMGDFVGDDKRLENEFKLHTYWTAQICDYSFPCAAAASCPHSASGSVTSYSLFFFQLWEHFLTGITCISPLKTHLLFVSIFSPISYHISEAY